LSPLGTAATVWPIVPAPNDRRWWLWSSQWNENWQGKPMHSEKTCPSATLCTTNPTWPDPCSNPDRRGGNPTTNRLSYDTTKMYISHSLTSSEIRYIQKYFSYLWMFCPSISNLKPSILDLKPSILELKPSYFFFFLLIAETHRRTTEWQLNICEQKWHTTQFE
jgi:hypothetical protein